jgi:hypothetical protein
MSLYLLLSWNITCESNQDRNNNRKPLIKGKKEILQQGNLEFPR